MIVEEEHNGVVCRTIIDFVVPTVEEALTLIAEGAINGRELLEEAGLSGSEAEATLAASGEK